MPTNRKQDLLNLALQEGLLLERVRAVNGTIEEQWQHYPDIFKAYTDVHRAYVEIAKEGDLEAMKRALFLQWFEVAEPYFLTGLNDLDAEAASVTLALVERAFLSQALDEEFMWMVSQYYLIADYYFQESVQTPNLIKYCRNHRPSGLVPPSGVVFHGRGQMGEYWESMCKS